MAHQSHLCPAFLPAAPLSHSNLTLFSNPNPNSKPDPNLNSESKSDSDSNSHVSFVCVSQPEPSHNNPNIFSAAVSLVSSFFTLFTSDSHPDSDSAGTTTTTTTTATTAAPQFSSSSILTSPPKRQKPRPDLPRQNSLNPTVTSSSQSESLQKSVAQIPNNNPSSTSSSSSSSSSSYPSPSINVDADDGLDARMRARSADDDDDGIQTRMAARRSRSRQRNKSSPALPSSQQQKRRRSPSIPFFSRQSLPPTLSPPPTYPSALRRVSDDKVFFLINSAVKRRDSTNKKQNPNVVTLLPYDLQQSLFDDLTSSTSTTSASSQPPFPATKNKRSRIDTNDTQQQDGLWGRSARFAVDAFRFFTFQQSSEQQSQLEQQQQRQQSQKGQQNSQSRKKIQNINEQQQQQQKQQKQQPPVAAYTAAAMANDSEGGVVGANSASAAFATAAAIASSAAAALHPAEQFELQSAVKQARAVANAEGAALFVETFGVSTLVTAAGVLPGPERATALTALANIAIVLPRARKTMLLVDGGALVDTIVDIVVRNAHFRVAQSSLWYTEALVSGTHVLGSLALTRNKEGREFRARIAKDPDVIRRLERLAGGLKNGEAEGAARAARRALGALGINQWKPRVPGQKGLRILSIDGGGTRAILAFETLKKLKKTTGCEIHELFDIIGGTSTGAIVAASIGIGHKTVEEVELLYRDMIGKVFARHPVNGPKMLLTRAYYDTNVLETTLQRECGRGVFIDSLADENMNRVFVVSSVMSRDPKELFLFRNYTYPLGHESRYDGTSEAQLWEALRASSAAPTFFSEIRINGELHADGAIVANNPTAVALHETRCMFPGVPIELLVSLGNGVSRSKNDVDNDNAEEKDDEEEESAKNKKQNNMGWGDVVGSIVASATSTETVHHAMQDLFPEDKYFRFNPTTDSTQIDETSPETLAMFVKEAQDYIAENVEKFDRVARILRPDSAKSKAQSLWRRFKEALSKEIAQVESCSYWEDDLYLPK